MRSYILSSFALLAVLPAALTQRQYHDGNHGPSTSTTLATVVVGGNQPPPTARNPGGVQTGNGAGQTGGGSATTGASSAQTSTPASTDKTAAKGVIYDPGNRAQAVSMAPSWACDWDVTAGVSTPPFQFVPQLWGPSHTITTADVAGSDYVLFYNEPDNCKGTGGACVPVGTTITDWSSKMKTFKDAGKKVSSPCVTNGGASFMETFLKAFKKGDIDIICFHWYDNNLASLQNTVKTFQNLKTTYGASELWLSEMGDNDKPADVSQYTKYLDGGVVDRYAYNLNYLGSGGTL